ncbi:hypothetical protein [Endozoicomonas ascidiicola]|uniref:hypothetical protein n=1 Tax=Endozoicomonas ascidiicola TaxID=1698521 RepID=UPI000A44D7D8|nr:hypothetical protein [Endozoicomonas ascidiicola]
MAEPVYDFEIESLEITSDEEKAFSKLISHIRQHHMTLDGALSDQESRQVLKLLNDINKSIAHMGKVDPLPSTGMMGATLPPLFTKRVIRCS